MSAPTPLNLAVRFFLVALLVFPGPGARAEEVTTLTAVADATIKQGSPSSNDGSSAEVESRSESSNNFRGLVRFDLTSIAATSAIKTSFLNMRLTTPPPASRSQAVHRVTGSPQWAELGVTWNSRDGVTNWTTAGADFNATAAGTQPSGTTQGATVQWTILGDGTVSNIPQGWLDGSVLNRGLLVKDVSEDAAARAVVKAVQSGTTSIDSNGGTNTITVPITSVNTASSFLIFQTRHNGNRPVNSMIRGRIASATTLEFVRVSNEAAPGVPINIQWYVAEFSSGVNVQRGEVAQSTTTINVPITPMAAVNQAFVTWSKTPTAGDGTTNSDDVVVGELTSTSNLQFRVNGANASHIISWQVIEFTNAADINVQKGTASLLGAALSTTITLGTAVNVNSTFVLCGYRSAGSGADIGARMLRAQLTNSTTITMDRDISGTPDDMTEILCQAVELTNGSTVQRGSENFLSGDSQKLVAITSVDTSRAIAFASVQPVGGQNMGRSPYAADDIIGVGSVTMALSSTQITMERARPSDNLVNAGLVVRYFMDEAASGQGPTQLLDAAAAPLNLPISYDASNYFYTEIETGRGWESTTVNNTGRASILADGTKVQTLLNGSTTGTIELVLRADAVNSSCTRLIHIGAGSESGYFTLQSCNLNNLNFYMLGGTLRGQWNPSFGTAGRTVLHLVYDSTQALAADRVRLYQDGTLLAKTGGIDPPLNETISIPIGKNFVVANRELCCRSFDGALYYAAYYNSGFSASQVSGNVNVLQGNDDANPAVTADIGWFVVEFADIPPEALRYGARENAGNEPQLEVHHLRNVSLGAASPGISEVTLNWTFPGGSTSADYDGVLFAKTLGAAPPTFAPADGTSYLVGDEPVAGETIVANTTSFATLTVVEENGADTVVLPGTQYTYNAHTHDATTITGAAQPSPPHYALGVSQSVTTLTGGGLNKNWSYRTGAATLAPPGLLPGNTVVAGSNDNKVHSMSAATGERRYQPVAPLGTTAGAIQSRSPVIPAASSLTGVDVTYVGAGDGKVYAFRTDTGDKLWESAVLGNSIQGAPAVQLKAFSNASYPHAFDLVVVGTRNTSDTTNNKIVALNGNTGSTVWTFDPGNLDIINSTPVVDLTNNAVWITSRAGATGTQPSIWKLDTTTSNPAGNLLDSVILTGLATADRDIDGSPTLNTAGTFLYAITTGGDLVAVDRASPINVFSIDTGAVSGVGFPIPLANGGNDDVYFSTSGGVHKRIFDRTSKTFSVGWDNLSITSPSTPIFTPPPLTLFLYVGDGNGRLNKIDPSSGAILVPRDVNLAATVGDPSIDTVSLKLYVGDTSGRIYSFDLF